MAGSILCRTDEPAHDPRREVAPRILLSRPPQAPEKLTHFFFLLSERRGGCMFLMTERW